MNKKSIIDSIDIQSLYHQELFNKYYLYKNVNYQVASIYGIQLFVSAFMLILKLIISKFFTVVNFSKQSLFISWSPLHTKRSKDLSEPFTIVEFYKFSFAKKQITLFSKVSIRKVISCFFKVHKISDLKTLENYSSYIKDTFSYRFLFVVEFLVLTEILTDVEQVFIAGYNDRTSLMISKLCEVHDIRLSMLQHGVLGKKEQWKPLKADRFFYLYPFSKAYISHQIEVDQSTELIYLPKKTFSMQLQVFEKGQFEKNIAYATSPANSERDIKILEELKGILQKKSYNLLIYPHPLENKSTYTKLEDNQSVFITRERHQNITHLISRYSTLGIDYHEQGIAALFLNFENEQSDFLNSDVFKVFSDMMSFKAWIQSSI